LLPCPGVIAGNYYTTPPAKSQEKIRKKLYKPAAPDLCVLTKRFFEKTLDRLCFSCYNNDRKKEREENKMTFVVSAYKTYEEFKTQKEARAYFNKIKKNFTYCELKAVDDNGHRYYSQSIEIWRK
jgi:hypothetical protein